VPPHHWPTPSLHRCHQRQIWLRQRWNHAWQHWSSPRRGGRREGVLPPPLTFAQTSAKTLARCHRTIAEGHQVRAPHRFPVCAPHRRWIWPLALPDSATLRHPQAKSGCRHLHALLTDMKKRSPAATILAGPSGCVAELAPEAAWRREEGRGVAEGGRSIAACVAHSRGHGAGL
jgi:hypothetical protein